MKHFAQLVENWGRVAGLRARQPKFLGPTPTSYKLHLPSPSTAYWVQIPRGQFLSLPSAPPPGTGTVSSMCQGL